MAEKRFKDFGSPKTETVEPVEFKLFDENFKCVANIQGRVLLGLVADSNSDDPAATSRLIEGFFKYILEEESYARFETLTKGRDHTVSVETLAEIIGWCIGEYTNRPEAQPEAS